MNPRFAILDLGTNTFHLLIADVKPDHSFEILYRQEEFVKLGEEGVERLGDRAFARGIAQLARYTMVIDQFQPGHVIGVGTAAIRKASNGDQFIEEVKKVCPMALRKITGDEEAELIYYGVRQAVELDEHPVLIMDIGGGSTEFIIANREKIFWKQSFPVGGSVLKRKFHHREPIAAAEQVSCVNYLQQELQPLLEQVRHFSIRQLVGASGSFDTLAQLAAENFEAQRLYPYALCTEIALKDFYRLAELLLRMSLEDRLKMKGMKWFRAEMIVVSAILAGYVVETCNIRRLTQSAFALKEGLLWTMSRKISIEKEV